MSFPLTSSGKAWLLYLGLLRLHLCVPIDSFPLFLDLMQIIMISKGKDIPTDQNNKKIVYSQMQTRGNGAGVSQSSQ